MFSSLPSTMKWFGSTTGNRDMAGEYTRVPLMLSESSDDEIYVKGISKYGDLELKLLPPTNGINPISPRPKSRSNKPRWTSTSPMTARQIVLLVGCILITFLVASLIILAVIESLPKLTDELPFKINTSVSSNKTSMQSATTILPTTHLKTSLSTEDWELQLNDTLPESPVRLVDVDGDGLDDIIFGTYANTDILFQYSGQVSVEQFCRENGLEFPCFGLLYALRGYDGKLLWKTKTIANSLVTNCFDFDVNNDGYKDCIVTGRVAMIQAINIRTGETLWYGDQSMMKQTWNNFQVAALPDYNEDGVPEIAIMNGGDPKKDSEDHNRESGRLIMLSGATGRMIGNRYLAMPNNKESYTSPVIYTCSDSSQYILFGSGGETIPGDFMMISVPDFYNYVSGDMVASPALEGEYNQWPHLTRDPVTNIITVYRGERKGVSVPPVIVDVDNDGVNDILVSAYDGKMILLNGNDMSIMWSVEFPDQESYSSPAPGYFDDDNILDFMVHWTVGKWPEYSDSKTAVINGKTGTVVWSLNSKMFEMSSDLSLKTNQKNRNAFIFKVKGRGANAYTYANGTVHHAISKHNKPLHQRNHLGGMTNVYRRHIGHDMHSPDPDSSEVSSVAEEAEYRKEHILCDDDPHINSEIFLMDRTVLEQPIRIASKSSRKYQYAARKHFTDTMTSNKTMCIVLLVEDRTSGAIGDVDGDGRLDLIYIHGVVGEIVDLSYSYQEMKYIGYVNKASLQPIINDKSNQVKLNVKTTLKASSYSQEPQMAAIELLNMEKQVWTQYMGKTGKSSYS